MGLMDKFKNLFTDEEIIEEDEVDTVEIKEVKKEEEVNKLPTFMREKIEKEEKSSSLKKDIDEDLNLKENNKKTLEDNDNFELPKIDEKPSFKFPLDLNDNDFVETRSRQSIHQRKPELMMEEPKKITSNKNIKITKKTTTEPKVADLYKDKKETTSGKTKTKFKATPIISPIYGILDKNYTSDDIDTTSRNDLESNRHSKSIDFDSVRKKAYGNLSKEIKENLMCENCEYLKEAKECQKEKEYSKEVEYDVVDDSYDENTYKDITLDEATENYYDYGVPYEKEDIEKETIEKDSIKISNFTDDNEDKGSKEKRTKKEIPPVKSSINLLSTLKKSMGDNVEEEPKKEENLELTDDLFNLIDSMYDERNEQ